MQSDLISVDVDIKNAKKKLKGFDRAIDKAARSALVKTAKSAKSFTKSSMAAKTGLVAYKVEKYLHLTINVSGDISNISATVKPSKRHPNLIEAMTENQIYAALIRKGKKGGRGRPPGKGIRSKAWGKSKVYKGTFIGAGKTSGRLLVYSRTGAGRRSPIEAKHGASPFAEFARPDFYDVLKAVTRKNFENNFRRNIKFFINKEIGR